MKTFKRLLSLTLVLIMVLSLGVNAFAATTNRFNASNSYCTVKISQSLLRKPGYQTATVKLKTLDQLGWSSGAKVVVTLKDDRGNTIWSGVKKATCTLKLGDDHSVYRIYVRPYYEPVTGGWIKQSIIRGNNFTNAGKCVKWVISNPKNCTIS